MLLVIKCQVHLEYYKKKACTFFVSVPTHVQFIISSLWLQYNYFSKVIRNYCTSLKHDIKGQICLFFFLDALLNVEQTIAACKRGRAHKSVSLKWPFAEEARSGGPCGKTDKGHRRFC